MFLTVKSILFLNFQSHMSTKVIIIYLYLTAAVGPVQVGTLHHITVEVTKIPSQEKKKV